MNKDDQKRHVPPANWSGLWINRKEAMTYFTDCTEQYYDYKDEYEHGLHDAYYNAEDYISGMEGHDENTLSFLNKSRKRNKIIGWTILISLLFAITCIMVFVFRTGDTSVIDTVVDALIIYLILATGYVCLLSLVLKLIMD